MTNAHPRPADGPEPSGGRGRSARPGTPGRPGRPPQTDEEQARIARPTFYRYFPNADEPLRIALGQIGRTLRDRIVTDVATAPGDIAKVVAAIDAYLWWSREHRHL